MLSVPLWVIAALLGAVAQTGRNATQASLTAALGTVGATQVRFLFGLPFAVLFLFLHVQVTGETPPALNATAIGWTVMGAWAQIAGTALMLLLMKSRAFGVATAWTKTEPVLVALLGVAFLGDHLTAGMLAAIALSVAGVLVLSLRAEMVGRLFDTGPALLGLLSGLGYGLAAIGFRGAPSPRPAGSPASR